MDEFWKEQEKEIIMHGEQLNAVETCIDKHAQETPDKLALVFETEKNKTKALTYKQLQKEVNKFANLLNKLKVKQNSRVFIFLPKVPESYIAFLGAIKHGSIPVPLFEAFQEEGLELRLTRGEADVFVTNEELSKRIPKRDAGRPQHAKGTCGRLGSRKR